jgi:hypothetical protein
MRMQDHAMWKAVALSHPVKKLQQEVLLPRYSFTIMHASLRALTWHD